MPAIAIVRLPHISNFNDFEPLRRLTGIRIDYVEQVQKLTAFKAVIIPGSKNTRWDLEWLRSTAWAAEIEAYIGAGGNLLGVCGGYQMMGTAVHDPEGIEGTPGSSQGLCLLPVETTLKSPKTTTLTRFSWASTSGVGYEIHMGQSDRKDGNALFDITARNGIETIDADGCISEDSRILGTYLHGIFDNPLMTRRWLDHLGLDDVQVPSKGGLESRDEQYELLAAHFEKHIRVEEIIGLILQADA